MVFCCRFLRIIYLREIVKKATISFIGDISLTTLIYKKALTEHQQLNSRITINKKSDFSIESDFYLLESSIFYKIKIFK